MALSGSFTTSAYDSRRLEFSWIATQSIANNNSTISWTLKAVGTGSWSKINAGNFRVTIDGVQVYYSSTRITTTDGLVIATGSYTIRHDVAGAGSFTVYAEAGIYYNAVNCTGSETFTLDTIPRQATLTSSPNFNDEENPTIAYSNPAGTAVTALEACISLGQIDDIAYRAIPKNGTSYTFNLTEAERTVLRNAAKESNSITVIFYLRTTINGTLYYSTDWRTMTIVNADPIIEPHVVDVNPLSESVTGGGVLVRYVSHALFHTNARAQKGAHITSQSVTCGGVTLEGETGTFMGVRSGDFVFTVTDSRGNTTTLPMAKSFVEYMVPTCSIGNERPDTNGNFTLTASGLCYRGTIGASGSNEMYVQYRYKVSGGEFGDWYDMSVVPGDNNYTATVNFTGLDYRTTYVFQCRVGDLLALVTTEEKAIKSMPVFDWSGEDFNFNVPVSVPSMSVGGIQLNYVATEDADYPGCYYRMVGDEKEWINPPMVMGVEYRTTERWTGKPVYTKLVDYGNLPASGEQKVPHGAEVDLPIEWHGVYAGQQVANCNDFGPVVITKTEIIVNVTRDVSQYTMQIAIKYTKST